MNFVGRSQKKQVQAGKVLQHTTLKFRLYPTPEQAELMEKTFGCCRYLWNQILSDVQEFYAATDVHYIPTPAHYKKDAPFLREVDSQALCTVHQNLRKAFMDFFRNPAVFSYPRFKTKKARRDSFTVYCREYRTGPSIYLTGTGLQMPKLGLVRAKVHRKPLHWWSLRFVTVSRTRSGKYFCAATFGYEVSAPKQVNPAPERTVGLNYSPSGFYVDSQGANPDLPATAKSREKLARMQKKLSRMVPGSQNYQDQLQKIRLLHEHIANQRKDFIHKESRRIANAWDAVCVRDTDLVELSQRLKQVRVMDSGFGLFRQCLQYKLARQGKPLIVLDRLAPTAKTCACCGQVNDRLTVRDRRWICPCCGAELVREVNAAQNIRDMGLEQFRKERQSAA